MDSKRNLHPNHEENKKRYEYQRGFNAATFIPKEAKTGSLQTHRMPFIESKEFRRIAVNLGAAIVQIAVTKPVVINTTSTHPGTSPL